ncbi:oxidoreductase [Aeromicrobium sp. Leaf350]|uniref:oxidoreductase n=1 Tax=Aeromicrobium sp. Leaf350 TaxID=2876565 RepID=UPI001E59ED8A|nr:oxidoreductase [Aeromicrobium sp. Leaf350]
MSATDDPFLRLATLEGIPSSFASARDGIDSVLRDRGLRRSTPEQTARSLLLGAAASATLEGDPVAPDDLAEGGGGPVARGALRMSSELLSLVPVWKRAPLQAIARVHALTVVDDAGPGLEPGRPVNPEGTHRLTRLARDLARPTAAPGLVVAALVHAEILAAGAFASHNGLVARAAERLVVVAAGVDPASLVVTEAGHADLEPAYRAASEAYRGGDDVGVHRWLLHAAEAFGRATAHAPVT